MSRPGEQVELGRSVLQKSWSNHGAPAAVPEAPPTSAQRLRQLGQTEAGANIIKTRV